MINSIDRIIGKLSALSIDDVKTAYIQRFYIERDRLDHVTQRLIDNGYEWIDDPGTPITDDGREVLHIGRRAFALRPDVHAERLRQSFEATKIAQPKSEPETKSVVGTEGMSSMTCPKCGDSLQHTAVCPKCAAGKLGYRHRYTCVCGGVDVISKEAL